MLRNRNNNNCRQLFSLPPSLSRTHVIVNVSAFLLLYFIFHFVIVCFYPSAGAAALMFGLSTTTTAAADQTGELHVWWRHTLSAQPSLFMQFSNLPFTHTHTHFLLPPSSHRTCGRGQIGCLSKKSFYLKSFFSLVTFWGYVVVCRIVCVCERGKRGRESARQAHSTWRNNKVKL